MYDDFVDSDLFHDYRKKLSAAYQGESEVDVDQMEDMIHADYKRGELSSSHYDNLMSLIQDIKG